jgi:hypothetical protein
MGAILSSEVAQVYDLFDGGLQAWSAYWTAWFNARSLDDVLRANAALAAESFSLAGLAAARRQLFHHVVTPTLNEA